MTPFDAGSTSEEQIEEENYFVSMTDMMVGVLFIFIIMLMVFALNFQEQTDEQEILAEDQILLQQRLREDAAEIAQRLEDLRSEVRDEIDVLDRQQQVRNELLTDIREALREQGLVVEIDETNGVLRLTEEAVRFSSGSAALIGQARVNVERIAAALAAVLPRYTACAGNNPVAGCGASGDTTVETVFIEGHTDFIGGDDTNWPLSADRAVATYRAIDAAQPQLSTLRNRAGRQIMSVSGYAATRPITSDGSVDGLAQNRRIDLRFVMETNSLGRLQEILALTDAMAGEIETLRLIAEE
jgi:chemotaxis protein MotB